MNKNLNNFNTCVDIIIRNIKDTKKSWNKNVKNWNFINEIYKYNNEYSLSSVLYWSICGQVDTAIRPVVESIIELIGLSNGYGLDCSNTVKDWHLLFMTGIKSSQIKKMVNAVAAGNMLINGDKEEITKILTDFYVNKSMIERKNFLCEFIDEYKNLCK